MNDFYLKGVKTLAGWIFDNRGKPLPALPRSTEHKSAPAPASTIKSGSTCIPCSIDHTATACGVLNESIRFARRDGVANEEVQKRIAKAEEELNTMERLDLDAQETAGLPEKQRQLVGWLASQSKNLRDSLKQINNLNDLENVTAQACNVRLEFRAKSMGLPQELVDISKKVETGEMSSKEAHKKIRELVQSEKR